MIGFFQYFFERRLADPVKLAQRVSRRHGTRTSFSQWEKVPKGGHIPLTSFDENLSSEAAEAWYDFQESIGLESTDASVRARAKVIYNDAHVTKNVPIRSLYATQPYVMTQDVDKLAAKISQTKPTHIHVIKFKNKHFIADGHHAAMAAKLRGERTVSVNLLDLDKKNTTSVL